MDSTVISLVAILLLGIACQLIAWFTRLPSILLLIAAGFIFGPVLGVIHPDALLGNLLEPVVSLSLAIILFEGGLNLKISEVKATGPTVLRLTTIGVLVTWVIATAAAVLLLDLAVPLAILLGAILVISGPTVVMPLLRYLRPGARVSAVLKWEGILIDPIGAILALLTLEIILVGGGVGTAVAQILFTLLKWAVFGGALGAAGALLMTQALRRHLLPDYLHVPAVLGLLGLVFLGSELIQPNAGLLAAIVMGAMLVNQRQANISHIFEFKENLRVLLISFLFVILSARLELSLFHGLTGALVLFILALVVIARPLTVFISAFRSRLKTGEKWLLAAISPRGIVSASVASVFAARLATEGYAGGEALLPITFAVVFGTILSSSLAAPLLLRGLRLGQVNPQGMVFFGGQIWVRDIATLLQKEGIACLIISGSKADVAYARRKGLDAVYADALEGSFLDDTDFSSYGYTVAMTADDHFNWLVALRLSKIFGSGNVFILPAAGASNGDSHAGHLPGRLLFSNKASFERITELYETGRIKLESLSEDLSKEMLPEVLGKQTLLMFALDGGGRLRALTAGARPEFKAGTRLIVLVQSEKG